MEPLARRNKTDLPPHRLSLSTGWLATTAHRLWTRNKTVSWRALSLLADANEKAMKRPPEFCPLRYLCPSRKESWPQGSLNPNPCKASGYLAGWRDAAGRDRCA